MVLNKTAARLGEYCVLAEYLQESKNTRGHHEPVRVTIYKVGHKRTPIFRDVIGVPPRSGRSELDMMRDAITSAFDFAYAEVEERLASTQEIEDMQASWLFKRYNRARAREEGFTE